MYAWTMLSEFNCQSATRVKNTIVFYYIHLLCHTLFNACHVCMWLVWFVFVMLKLTTQRASPCNQLSTFLRDIWPEETCSLQLPGQIVQQLRSIGFIMTKHKVQFSVSVVYLCAYGYILNTLHNLIQLPCMHEIQLAMALAYVLMYYYGNTASYQERFNQKPKFHHHQCLAFWKAKML